MPYDLNKVPKGMGIISMKKIFYLLILGITPSLLLFGQNKVLLENGSSMSFSHISIAKDLVNIDVNGERRSINKTDILCIIPERGKSYTFRKKNNVKLKIAPKDIKDNYAGADIPRLFAYKYYKSNTDVSDIYRLFQGVKLSQFDFEGYYHAQQQKIRSRATTATILSVVLLAISVGGLIRTLSDVKAVSYNYPEEVIPNIQKIKYQPNNFEIVNQRDLKLCA